MSGWGYFLLLLILLVIIAAVGWVVYTRIQANRAGLPPPPLSAYNPFTASSRRSNPSSQIYPATGGAVGWVKDKYHAVRTRFGGGGGGGGGGNRSGAYEQTSGSAGVGMGRGGRGLDPDEAWDTRVGGEADGYGPGGYYEEQELGLTGASAGHDGPYGGRAMPAYGSEEMSRGRSLGRDDDTAYIGGNQAGLDRRYDEEVHGGSGARDNPFGDGAERSELRGVSPRPHDERGQGQPGLEVKGKDGGDSPTERRSMFRENV